MRDLMRRLTRARRRGGGARTHHSEIEIARPRHRTAKLGLAVAACALVLPASGPWTQQAHLCASDAANFDKFGQSLDISGDTLVVGASNDNSSAGSAYVFTRDGVGWIRQARLVASDASADDHFGRAVAVDGDTIVVGASGDETPAGADAGSAYVFTRSGTTWSQQDHLFAGDGQASDWFGRSVGIDGDTIVVGAPRDDTGAGGWAGSAYVFTRVGASWSQQDHLFASDAGAGDHFGWSVGISGEYIVSGAKFWDSFWGTVAGSAYVFIRNGSTWSEQAHIVADDRTTGDQFGTSVAIFGNTVVVGSRIDETDAGVAAGSAYVFTRLGTFWSQQDHLFADDAEAGDRFGNSVAIHGDIVVVGTAEDDTVAGVDAGSVYVYSRDGMVWSQEGHLFSGDASAGDEFGGSVAVDEATAVAGAPLDSTSVANTTGSVYVFRRGPFLEVFVGEQATINPAGAGELHWGPRE